DALAGWVCWQTNRSNILNPQLPTGSSIPLLSPDVNGIVRVGHSLYFFIAASAAARACGRSLPSAMAWLAYLSKCATGSLVKSDNLGFPLFSRDCFANACRGA